MKSRRLFWQLFPTYLLVSVSIVILVLVYATGTFRDFYLEQKAADLRDVASLLSTQPAHDSVTDYRAVRSSNVHRSLRVTVIDAEGTVLSDTNKNPEEMDSHLNRPEIVQAIQEGYGESIRYSDTLGHEMMYVALPMPRKADGLQVIRVSLPVTSINTALKQIYSKLIFACFLIILLAIVFSFYFSRQMSRPVEQLKSAAIRFADGDLDHKAKVSSPEELQSLAKAMNHMALQLKGKIETISNQKNELDVMLSCMKEGVISLDTDTHIKSINKAALSFLEVGDKGVRGKLISEVVRNSELQEFITNVFAKEEAFQSEIFLRGDRSKVLEVNGTVLRDSAGIVMGVLLVLHDVTEYKRLESVRTDFVANVSHELRTPITSIKGFLEALVEGAKENPEELKQFLDIIIRQTDRLNSIIEDLLSLAKIERGSEDGELELVPLKVSDIFDTAVELSEPKALAKRLTLKACCDEFVVNAEVNPHLIEQALLNLIDNAIKYSKVGDDVLITGAQRKSELVLSVKDYGCGIERKHHCRLFERFYRVDKARSRELGGTGLGLAIVKHIAQAHGGSVVVESAPEKGSTFSIHIPLAA